MLCSTPTPPTAPLSPSHPRAGAGSCRQQAGSPGPWSPLSLESSACVCDDSPSPWCRETVARAQGHEVSKGPQGCLLQPGHPITCEAVGTLCLAQVGLAQRDSTGAGPGDNGHRVPGPQHPPQRSVGMKQSGESQHRACSTPRSPERPAHGWGSHAAMGLERWGRRAVGCLRYLPLGAQWEAG